MANETDGPAGQESSLKSGGNIEVKAGSTPAREGQNAVGTRSGGNIETKGASHTTGENTRTEEQPGD